MNKNYVKVKQNHQTRGMEAARPIILSVRNESVSLTTDEAAELMTELAKVIASNNGAVPTF